ncbi:hypothetical protein ACM26V_03645 [Salipaludibacillus sp. HK11]|uniref:hypothetical protein n=1 Tax=Salipaludibacillus sp. HK11 TaxID=3394320 RepID=UPI0039FBC09F
MDNLIFIIIVLALFYAIYAARKFANSQEKKMDSAQNEYEATIKESRENLQTQKEILYELKEIRKSLDSKNE